MVQNLKNELCHYLNVSRLCWNTTLPFMKNGLLDRGKSKKLLNKLIANRAQLSQNVTPHILRHTFATVALQKGISLAAVQKILGHDRLTTTAIYLNLTDIHITDEFEKKW